VALMPPQFHLAAGRPRSTPWALLMGDLYAQTSLRGCGASLAPAPAACEIAAVEIDLQTVESTMCSPLGALRPSNAYSESVIGTCGVIGTASEMHWKD
jgi:hypothetical protein